MTMKLTELCQGFSYELVQGNPETEVTDIIYDSRKITEGTLFVCIVGAVTDGHRFIPDAIEKKASVLVVEYMPEEVEIPTEIAVVKVEDAKLALAHLSASYFGNPANQLKVVGITGTKGKTTTTYMIKEVLEAAGKKVGLIGTNGSMIGSQFIPSQRTTPQSYELHQLFRQMADADCEYVVMEVSSQGLKLHRTAGIPFAYGVFTNLSEDHIGPGEHADFDEYLYCKSLLFRQCKKGIVNADDAYADGILKDHTCEIVSFSADDTAATVTGEAGKKAVDYLAAAINFHREKGRMGMHFTVDGKVKQESFVDIPGRFSVYNAMTAMVLCVEEQIPMEYILTGLSRVQVKGRVENVPVPGDYSIIIDYAHNDVSTRSVLTTLREYKPKRLIALYGCGGNRSKVRRYDVGEAAGELADLSVLTMDNPRDEEVKDINNDIKVGLARSNGKYVEIEDRKEALAYCITHAQPGDIIVTLGKGHEDYQEIKGVKYHFDEREAIAEVLEEIAQGKRTIED